MPPDRCIHEGTHVAFEKFHGAILTSKLHGARLRPLREEEAEEETEREEEAGATYSAFVALRRPSIRTRLGKLGRLPLSRQMNLQKAMTGMSSPKTDPSSITGLTGGAGAKHGSTKDEITALDLSGCTALLGKCDRIPYL